MSTLAPCLACNRHVRSGEVCPFCGAPSVEANASPMTRASRAALFAIATAACGGAQVDVYGGPPPPPADASAPEANVPEAATPPAASSETTHVSAYGGPPQPTVAPPQITPKH